MALELVQPGIQPLGQFDGKDDILTTVKGGEVVTITAVTIGADKAAADVDGYVGTTRPAVTTELVPGSAPLFLVDDGTAGYGTLFGSLIGGTAGQASYGLGASGQQLGPHTAYASGKLTLWDKQGTYAVTLDAVDTDVVNGLVPTNAGLSIGDKLYATGAGLLTPDVNKDFGDTVTVGFFLNFEPYKGGSLVTTPVSLVSAANSPVGQGQPQVGGMSRALIHFNPQY